VRHLHQALRRVPAEWQIPLDHPEELAVLKFALRLSKQCPGLGDGFDALPPGVSL
jgi:hypothetical protein